MAVTIKDVARLANVSPSTVSRVLSDSSMISQETKEVVRKAVKELRYHPHAIARSLANKETRTIGLILHSNAEEAFLNQFYPELIRGISNVLTAMGYFILLSTSKNDVKGNEELIRLASERRVDGLILLTSWVDDSVVRELKEEAFPTVVIGKPSEDIKIDWVDNDNQESAYKIVEHLLKKGYKKIAYMGGSYRLMVTAERLKGYVDALINNDIEVIEDYFKECDYSEESAYNAMNELFALPEPPDSIICSDDNVVFGALRAIRERNLRVPQEIGVVAFNNTLSTSYTSPSITSMELDAMTLGKNAATMLIDRIKNYESEVNSLIIPARFIPRESTNRGE